MKQFETVRTVTFKDRDIEVTMQCTMEVDNAYGADADGRRGERRVEFVVQSAQMSWRDMQGMSIEDIAHVLEDAERIFHEEPTRGTDL
jgi:hypothetical protein